jgi:hypothetical protein
MRRRSVHRRRCNRSPTAISNRGTIVAKFLEEQDRLAAEILVDQLQPGQSILSGTDSDLDFDLLVRGSTARPESVVS